MRRTSASVTTPPCWQEAPVTYLGPLVTAVAVETSARRTFAWAVDWPGWCRAGKGEQAALAALEAAAPRYAVVVAEAGLAFPRSAARSFDVVDRAQGTATTDFGAPDRTTDADLRGLGRAGASRLAELVAASWRVLADVAAGAPPELRKGPRGRRARS